MPKVQVARVCLLVRSSMCIGWAGVRCGVMWCGVVWCGVVWCGVVWCGVVWCGVVWYGVREPRAGWRVYLFRRDKVVESDHPRILRHNGGIVLGNNVGVCQQVLEYMSNACWSRCATRSQVWGLGVRVRECAELQCEKTRRDER
jgi:hypothetical protein